MNLGRDPSVQWILTVVVLEADFDLGFAYGASQRLSDETFSFWHTVIA